MAGKAKKRRFTARAADRSSPGRSGSAAAATPTSSSASSGTSDRVSPEIGVRGKWTATAAARTAREARIATAAYLRTAPIAPQWEITRIMSAHQMWRQHLSGQIRRDHPNLDLGSAQGAAILDQAVAALFYGGSGLSEPYPTDLNDATRRLLDLRAADLETATLYVISPSMCDVAIAAAQTLTVDDLALLDHDDLPSPTGMLLLPHPILVRAVTGDLGDDRAYVWHSPAELSSATETGQLVIRPGVRVTTYLDGHGPVRPDSFRDMAAMRPPPALRCRC